MEKTEEEIRKLLHDLLEENPADIALEESNAEINALNAQSANGVYSEPLEPIKSEQTFSFRRYKNRSYIGRKLLEDLIEKRNDGEYVKIDKKTGEKKLFHGYYLKESNKKVGLSSQLYGASGIFTLITRFNALNYSAKDKTEEGKTERAIKSAVYDVLEYVSDNGYDLDPFIDEKTNNELFHNNNENIQYVGAMTWALSLFVQVRKAIRNNVITFTQKGETDESKIQEQTEKINLRTMEEIRKIIQFFIDNAIDDKKTGLFGWGYANGCIEPSLFFTYSVIEAYSDFEDNVLLDDTDDELLEYINQGIDKPENYLHVRYKALCEYFGDRTWEIYKDALKNNFFSDKFDGKANIVTKDEILRSGRSSALFNNLYIIFILFYSSTNRRHPEDSDKIVNAMMRSLQLVQNFYNDLKEDGNENIVDMHMISFNQKNLLVPDFNKYLKDTSILASSLLPLLVKANNLIAYWILRFPQKTMSEMFDEMLKYKLSDKWLWEDPKFDLLSTERYIEAIADFYDYYDAYEARYITDAQQKQANEILTERNVKKEIKKKVDKGIERLKEKAISDARDTVSEMIRSEFEIENAINKRIDGKIEEQFNKLIMKFFRETFSAITANNTSQYADKEQKDLTEEQKDMQDILHKYLESFLFSAEDLHDAAMAEDKSVTTIKNATMKDMMEFRKEYHKFIARHCEQYGDKAKLSDIFRIIEKNR